MKKEKKITSEKPVSLHPLKFDEALKTLLKVPPKKDKEDTKKPSVKN